jgi:hypothetical protein
VCSFTRCPVLTLLFLSSALTCRSSCAVVADKPLAALTDGGLDQLASKRTHLNVRMTPNETEGVFVCVGGRANERPAWRAGAGRWLTLPVTGWSP